MKKRGSVSRRSLIQAALGAGLISSGFAQKGLAASADSQADRLDGLVSVYKLGSLTLHSYMAPSSHAAVTTQIIETANELHIIDTQMVQGLAKEARSYADSLGKPIAGVYLSHWHPDHLLGAVQYTGIPFLTSADIAADCSSHQKTYTARKQLFKDETPMVLPSGTLKPGEQLWDGLSVVVTQVNDCESEHALTFYFPESGLMIVQDLMFNNAHAFPLGNHSNWTSTLEDIRNTEGLRLVGCGHGLPATAGAISDSISYLKIQKEIFGSENDAAAAVASLNSQFPNYEGQSVLRFVDALYK